MLIDLVYQELDASAGKELDAHLASCDACRQELAKLQMAKGAVDKNLAQLGAMAPAAPLFGAGAAMSSERSRPTRRPIFFKAGLISAGAAIAAGLAIFFTVWLAQTPPATAQSAAVEIKKVNVSLTILSNPEDQEQYDAPQAPRLNLFQGQRAYVNVNGVSRPPQSLALIRDQRLIKNLPAGKSEIRFTDVPTGILPESVRLHSLDRPDGLTILEQDYQYDLAWAGAILKKYIDKPITVTLKDNSSVTGKLLSYQIEAPLPNGRFGDIDMPLRWPDAAAPPQMPMDEFFSIESQADLVIQPEGQGPRTIEPREIKAILAEKLPLGLLTKPTLVWQVQAAVALQQQFEVAYLTHGLSWRADYVLRLRPGKARPSAPGASTAPYGQAANGAAVAPGAMTRGAVTPSEPAPGSGDIFDTADIVGYATVANNSGTTFEDAQLKLMAGDVHMVQPETVKELAKKDNLAADGKPGDAKAFEEKSFFEYHLYTLGRPATLKNAETKQIELLSADGVKMRRIYIYDPNVNATAAAVASELVNSKANSMGMPLPKGMVRLYAPDPDGQDQFVAATPIDHTPTDEKIRFVWGHAMDIACEARQTQSNVSGGQYDATWQYDIRNHKDYDVKVTVVVHVPATASKGSCKLNGKDYAGWTVPQVGRVEIEVPVKANEALKVEFSFESNSQSGGGLKPPKEKN
jgi:hypothetical protein